MAYETIAITPGVGASVVTDHIAGVGDIQVMKLDLGADGVSVPVVGALPVSAASGVFVDGADATQGVTSDPAVTGDTAGTLSAKLRGMNKIAVNVQAVLLANGARTATTPSPDQTNDNKHRLTLLVDVSAQSGGSVTPSLQVKDSISGNYVTIWTAAVPLTSVGTYAYYFSDGANSGNFQETRGFGLPSKVWRLNMAHNNASSITYSASAELMVR